MYSDDDLQSAVHAGVIDAKAADALREYVGTMRDGPVADEENFRLASGFNDIFVTIASVIMLVAMWWIGDSLQSDLHNYTGKELPLAEYSADGRYKAAGAFFCAGTAWLLAEYFVRRRRMALPGIALLLAFTVGILMGVQSYFTDMNYTKFGYASYQFQTAASDSKYYVQVARDNGIIALSALGAAMGALLFWWRMRAPIAIATASGMSAASLIFGIFYFSKTESIAGAGSLPLILIMASGLAIFAFAMWWDISDTDRKTQRSDIAFWLHLLAAPMIAHALFALVVTGDGGEMSTSSIALTLGLYAFFAVVAIMVDRRALLVSALAYVLIAMSSLFRDFGFIELGFAITALIIGSALLLLSAFWAPIRRMLLRILPSVVTVKLPAPR
jgi:hypothetical protein